MMGRQSGDQASLFYEFRLDDRIPKDHLLRRIDGFAGSTSTTRSRIIRHFRRTGSTGSGRVIFFVTSSSAPSSLAWPPVWSRARDLLSMRDCQESCVCGGYPSCAHEAFPKSRDERKRVEMRFVHLKTRHGCERLRLRGLSDACGEYHLAAIVQNLKILALRAIGRLAVPQPTSVA